MGYEELTFEDATVPPADGRDGGLNDGPMTLSTKDGPALGFDVSVGPPPMANDTAANDPGDPSPALSGAAASDGASAPPPEPSGSEPTASGDGAAGASSSGAPDSMVDPDGAATSDMDIGTGGQTGTGSGAGGMGASDPGAGGVTGGSEGTGGVGSGGADGSADMGSGGMGGSDVGGGGAGGAPDVGSGGAGGAPEVGAGGAGGVPDVGSGGAGGGSTGGAPDVGGGGAGGAPDVGSGGAGGGSAGGAGGTPGATQCVPDANCSCGTYQGHDYRFCPVELWYSEALADCESVGMTLVRVDDQAENDWLLSELLSRSIFASVGSAVVFLGGSDATTEGEWYWEDGEIFWNDVDGSLLYENWAASSPKVGGVSDCLGIREDGQWEDRACNSGAVTYVCESVWW